MSLDVQNIRNQVNLYVRQDPVRSYQNMRLNSIFLQILELLDGLTSGIVTGISVLRITGANFTSSVDCPLTSLDGEELAIFFQDRSNYLQKGVDYTDLVGGGFTIIMPGFDATGLNLTSVFYVQIQSN